MRNSSRSMKAWQEHSPGEYRTSHRAREGALPATWSGVRSSPCTACTWGPAPNSVPGIAEHACSPIAELTWQCTSQTACSSVTTGTMC
eukprot:3390614-Rhodomonas_salina.3